MRVMIINTNTMCYDGIMSVIFNYVENMDKSDMSVDFVAVNQVEDSIRQRIETMGSKLYIVPFRIKNPVKYVIYLSKILWKGNYTVSHIHGSSCIMAVEMLAAKLAGVPACPHSHSTNCEHKIVHQILKPLFRLLYKKGFACEAEAGQWLYGDRHFEIIKNGINIEKFTFNRETRIKFRQKLGLSEDESGIIHVAHFTEVKNHGFIINVFKKVIEETKKQTNGSHGNFKLFLLGQGETMKATADLVKKFGLQDKVIFVGITQEVPQYFNACDLMVLPSRYEGFPLTALEAQSTGIRCLISDMVTKKCCFSDEFKYIPLNEKMWVDEILTSGNNYKREELCRRNQERIINSGYDIKAITNHLKQLYVEYGKHSCV